MSNGYEGKYHEEMAELKLRRRSSATLERVQPQRSKKMKPWRVRVGNWTIGHYRTEQIAKNVIVDMKRKRTWMNESAYEIDYVD